MPTLEAGDKNREPLIPLFRYRKLDNSEVFRYPGQEPAELALVLSGIIRHYAVDSSGSEKTTDFCKQGEFTGVLGGEQEKSALWLASVGKTELAVADAHEVMNVIDKNLELQRLFSATLYSYLQLKDRRETELLALNPAERYEAFTRNFPDILNAIPQYLIASYLGITPETLSRIRNRRNRS